MAPLPFPWPQDIGREVLRVIREELEALALSGRKSPELACAAADLALVYECDRPVIGEYARRTELPVYMRRQVEEAARETGAPAFPVSRGASSSGDSASPTAADRCARPDGEAPPSDDTFLPAAV